MTNMPPPYAYLHLDTATEKWTVHDEPGPMRVAVWTKNLIESAQPAPGVGGSPFGDERWVAVKPTGAPYYGIHTESGATVAGTSSGLSEQDAKHICGLHNNELCEADDLIRCLGFDPTRFRSEGGRINYYRLATAIRHPEDYDGLALSTRPAESVAQGGEGWQKCYSAIIKALAAMATVHTPDTLFDLDAIPRDPIMDHITRIKSAIDAYS